MSNLNQRVVTTGVLLTFLAFFGAGGVEAEPCAQQPVKVFILAGQSNMVGQAKMELLEYQATAPETRAEFVHLRKDGGWVVRDDVWIKFRDRAGKLTVGYGGKNRIGPELEFGNVVGDYYAEQVLLIKTAWGGKSLYVDFRPPGAGLPERQVLESMLEGMRRKNPDATLEDAQVVFGASYREMISEIKETLANLKMIFPDYHGQGYEIAGMVWFQGWNDMIHSRYTSEYTENMAHFIRDVRKDLGVPKLPVVIGQMGVNGVKADLNPKLRQFKEAQATVAGLPEFHTNVSIVRTDVFWDLHAEAVFAKGWRENFDEWVKVGSDYGYHYLGSARTFCRIGKAFGKAMIDLANQTAIEAEVR